MGWDISTLQRTGILQEHTLGTAHSWNSPVLEQRTVIMEQHLSVRRNPQ